MHSPASRLYIFLKSFCLKQNFIESKREITGFYILIEFLPQSGPFKSTRPKMCFHVFECLLNCRRQKRTSWKTINPIENIRSTFTINNCCCKIFHFHYLFERIKMSSMKHLSRCNWQVKRRKGKFIVTSSAFDIVLAWIGLLSHESA